MPSDRTQIDLSTLPNRSILLVDDTHSIHRDYNAVLRPSQNDPETDRLDQLEAMLLDEPVDENSQPAERNFQLQSAYQGEEALELVTKHFSKGIQYPLALIDMRMPPGWDGLETIEKLRTVDPELQFVVVTAYSDYSEDEIKLRLGPDATVQIVHKPFDPTALYQLCFELVSSWNAENP